MFGKREQNRTWHGMGYDEMYQVMTELNGLRQDAIFTDHEQALIDTAMSCVMEIMNAMSRKKGTVLFDE